MAPDTTEGGLAADIQTELAPPGDAQPPELSATPKGKGRAKGIKRKTPSPKILNMPKIVTNSKKKKAKKTAKAKMPNLMMPAIDNFQAAPADKGYEEVKVEEKTIRFMAVNSLVLTTFGHHSNMDTAALGRLFTRLGVATDSLTRVAGEDADRWGVYDKDSAASAAMPVQR